MAPNRDDEADGPPTQPDRDWRTLCKECDRVAKLLEQVGFISRRIDFTDTAREQRAREMRLQLREFSRRFSRWASLGVEAIAVERRELLPQLIEVLDASLALLKTMPDAGALGKIRKPPR